MDTGHTNENNRPRYGTVVTLNFLDACQIKWHHTLTLAGFEAALGFVDHINAALAAHHTAIPVAVLERAKRVSNLHGLSSCRGAVWLRLWVTGQIAICDLNEVWWAVQGSNL